MLVRGVVKLEPGQEPEQTQAAGQHHRGPPASALLVNEQHEKRRDGSSHRRATIEQRHRPGPFFMRKPLGNGFSRSRPVRPFAGSEEKAKDAKSPQALRRSRQDSYE